jgi:hypothetical protein
MRHVRVPRSGVLLAALILLGIVALGSTHAPATAITLPSSDVVMSTESFSPTPGAIIHFDPSGLAAGTLASGGALVSRRDLAVI